MKKKRVKVIQFIHAFTIGGAENLVKQYCLLFDKNEIELKVICLHNAKSVFDKELHNADIDVVYIDDIIDNIFNILPLTLKKVMHRIFRKIIFKKEIENFNPDVIHYHLQMSDYIKFARPSKKTKIVLTAHSEPEKLWSGTRKRKKDLIYTRWLMEHYNMQLIALHSKMREQLNEIFGVENTSIINNGIYLNKFKNLPTREELRKKNSISENALVIGHVGRFIYVKNHRFLIEVFQEIYKKNSNAVLILIGDGSEKESIVKLVEEYSLQNAVKFLGVRSDIPELMKMMDIIVFPSIFEGLSVTLIEAQISGIPCLISDNIATETAISNLIEFKSLDESAIEWAKSTFELLEKNIIPECNTESWDIEKIVLELQEIYRR